MTLTMAMAPYIVQAIPSTADMLKMANDKGKKKKRKKKAFFLILALSHTLH